MKSRKRRIHKVFSDIHVPVYTDADASWQLVWDCGKASFWVISRDTRKDFSQFRVNDKSFYSWKGANLSIQPCSWRKLSQQRNVFVLCCRDMLVDVREKSDKTAACKRWLTTEGEHGTSWSSDWVVSVANAPRKNECSCFEYSSLCQRIMLILQY